VLVKRVTIAGEEDSVYRVGNGSDTRMAVIGIDGAGKIEDFAIRQDPDAR
jgi:hypothetical protein